jgi:hypothetical protein
LFAIWFAEIRGLKPGICRRPDAALMAASGLPGDETVAPEPQLVFRQAAATAAR